MSYELHPFEMACIGELKCRVESFFSYMSSFFFAQMDNRVGLLWSWIELASIGESVLFPPPLSLFLSFSFSIKQ